MSDSTEAADKNVDIWKVKKLIKNLGKRNSGGCIRLHPTNAKALFEELISNHRGQVPAFDWNEREGQALRTDDGAMQMTRGLKVLLVVVV
mgnify:CR=1 FL=1